MIETVLLDLDGPVLDGKLRHHACYSGILIEHGFKPLAIDDYWKMKRQPLDRHHQLAASQADGIYDIFLNLWLTRIEQEKYLALDRLQSGAVEKLEGWKSAGTNIVLVTMRNHAENLKWQLKSLGLDRLLDDVAVVGAADGSAGKTAAAMKWINNAEKVLWIGDTEADIEAARKAGVGICALSCGLRSADFLAALKPDFLVSSLSAVELH